MTKDADTPKKYQEDQAAMQAQYLALQEEMAILQAQMENAPEGADIDSETYFSDVDEEAAADNSPWAKMANSVSKLVSKVDLDSVKGMSLTNVVDITKGAVHAAKNMVAKVDPATVSSIKDAAEARARKMAKTLSQVDVERAKGFATKMVSSLDADTLKKLSDSTKGALNTALESAKNLDVKSLSATVHSLGKKKNPASDANLPGA